MRQQSFLEADGCTRSDGGQYHRPHLDHQAMGGLKHDMPACKRLNGCGFTSLQEGVSHFYTRGSPVS